MVLNPDRRAETIASTATAAVLVVGVAHMVAVPAVMWPPAQRTPVGLRWRDPVVHNPAGEPPAQAATSGRPHEPLARTVSTKRQGLGQRTINARYVAAPHCTGRVRP